MIINIHEENMKQQDLHNATVIRKVMPQSYLKRHHGQTLPGGGAAIPRAMWKLT